MTFKTSGRKKSWTKWKRYWSQYQNFVANKNAYVIEENHFNCLSGYLNFLLSWHDCDAVFTLCSLTDRLSGTEWKGHFHVSIIFNSWTSLLLSNKTLVYFSPFLSNHILLEGKVRLYIFTTYILRYTQNMGAPKYHYACINKRTNSWKVGRK
jgi:hypothetical protein